MAPVTLAAVSVSQSRRRDDLTLTDDADVIELLREILAELRLSNRGRRSHEVPAEALLPVLAAAVQDRAFSAREVIAHRMVEVALREALDSAGLANPRQLGKWLRTIEGRTIAGARLERIGLDRDGIIWRVWRV